MIAVYLEVLNAADFLFVALQHLVATNLLRRIPLLQLDSHVVAERNKAGTIDYARVLTYLHSPVL